MPKGVCRRTSRVRKDGSMMLPEREKWGLILLLLSFLLAIYIHWRYS